MVRKATSLIAEAFDKNDFIYTINDDEESSIIEADYSVKNGPKVHFVFASKDDNNDVAVRIYGLLQKITSDNYLPLLKACNTMNETIRFLKFYIHDDDLIAEYDLPMETSDECLGDCCVELVFRFMHILNSEYHIFPEAIYGCDKDHDKRLENVLRVLNELRNNPIILEDHEPLRNEVQTADNKKGKVMSLSAVKENMHIAAIRNTFILLIQKWRLRR